MDLKTLHNKQELKGIEREIRVHFSLNHPHIIKLYDCFYENNQVYMIMEWAKNGNLYSHLYRKKKFDEKESFRFFFQTCRAIHYLHNINIIHRDVKVIDKAHSIYLFVLSFYLEMKI